MLAGLVVVYWYGWLLVVIWIYRLVVYSLVGLWRLFCCSLVLIVCYVAWPVNGLVYLHVLVVV